jgi:hypothetical protein
MAPGINIAIWLTIPAGIGLALAAWRYDRWITQLEQRGHHHGYVSLLVAAGCAGVLLVSFAVAWPLGPAARIAVALASTLFIPAGLPMIIGSIRRHVTARAAEQQRIIAEAKAILGNER